MLGCSPLQVAGHPSSTREIEFLRVRLFWLPQKHTRKVMSFLLEIPDSCRWRIRLELPGLFFSLERQKLAQNDKRMPL